MVTIPGVAGSRSSNSGTCHVSPGASLPVTLSVGTLKDRSYSQVEMAM